MLRQQRTPAAEAAGVSGSGGGARTHDLRINRTLHASQTSCNLPKPLKNNGACGVDVVSFGWLRSLAWSGCGLRCQSLWVLSTSTHKVQR